MRHSFITLSSNQGHGTLTHRKRLQRFAKVQMGTSDRRQYLGLTNSTGILRGSFSIGVELFLFLVYPGDCFVFVLGFTIVSNRLSRLI